MRVQLVRAQILWTALLQFQIMYMADANMAMQLHFYKKKLHHKLYADPAYRSEVGSARDHQIALVRCS